MSQTLNLPLPAGRPLRSSSSSASSLRFLRRLPLKSSKKCRASIGAVATEADPAVIDSRRQLSLYEVLRVNQNASPTEIKSAYRSLAKLYHPDSSAVRRSESDEMDFIAIHNAYETLSDPSARALYDLSLTAARRRRRPYLSSMQDRSSGFCTTQRWETDQCW